MNEPPDALDELARLLSSGAAPIDRSLLLLSEALQQAPGITAVGLQKLDDLASDVLANSDDRPTLRNLTETLFVQHRFVGDVEDYHGEDNSFLDHVLERRIGMPITLSAVAACVGRRAGLNVSLIGLPGHVVVGEETADGHFESFIDAFSGSQVDRLALSQRLSSIFSRPVEVSDAMLVPMTTASIVSRVCNNLTRTWASDRVRLNRLIDVRSALPQPDKERLHLAHLAETQGRFDVAAKLRELVDPEDPTIEALWGRLN